MTFLLKSLRKKKGVRRYIGPKRIFLFLIIAVFVIWTWDYYKSGALSPAIIEQYKDQYPIGAILLFISVYTISTIAALPSLPLNLAAGFFWGGLIGGIYSTIGVTIGGWLSLLIARWLIGQPLADRFENKWVSRVQNEFERNGWKFVAFARINPIIPTGPLNYLLGLTSLSNRTFLWATFIFLLPPAIAIAYIGDTLQTFTTRQSDVSEIIHGILIASAAITFLAAVKFASGIYKKRSEKK
ncbi:MAG: VTT domain-containing protein [Candidatus Thiosymbion ectosymbiont of Robbea hypermnestra]|nr:VTT domain-containing protein [Candidatus Thiosymbion ectosymbiont of Robbea hypermnestra]